MAGHANLSHLHDFLFGELLPFDDESRRAYLRQWTKIFGCEHRAEDLANHIDEEANLSLRSIVLCSCP